MSKVKNNSYRRHVQCCPITYALREIRKRHGYVYECPYPNCQYKCETMRELKRHCRRDTDLGGHGEKLKRCPRCMEKLKKHDRHEDCYYNVQKRNNKYLPFRKETVAAYLKNLVQEK